MPLTTDFAERSAMEWRQWIALLRLDAGELDHLSPLLGFLCDELAKVGGRAGKYFTTQFGHPYLHRRIGEHRVSTGSAHDAALAEMNLGELAVRVDKLQSDRPRRLGPAASDFGKRVFETVDHVDAHAVLRPGHRIEDRFATAFGQAGHDQASLSPSDVELKLERSEDRIVQFVQRGREYVEDRLPGLGVLTGEDAQQRRPLRLGCAFVDHHRRFALALVDRTRPAEDSDELQAIELGRAVMTLLDLEAADRLAMSVRRQSVELAGAAVGAVAVDELTSLDGPFGVRHGRLLTGRSARPYPLSRGPG